MKVFKNLFKRDRSNRRHSDSHDLGMTSPISEISFPKSNNDFDDPIRTPEYKRALSAFCARRSLGPNVTLNSQKKDESVKLQTTPELSGKRLKNRKSKRRSLPDSTSKSDHISPSVPQIQFLFKGQIFMPGSGVEYSSDKSYRNEDSFDIDDSGGLSTSPDLLPPRFLRGNQQIDFDECQTPASPPKNFFKDNSLPYVDKSALSNEYEIEDSSMQSDKLDMSETRELDDDSCSSVVRKLEQMCDITSAGSYKYFRGIPLVKSSTLDLSEDNDPSEHWIRGSWTCIAIQVKKNIKSRNLNGAEIISLDDLSGRELEILTKFRHPNFLLLLGLCYDDSNNYNIQQLYEYSIGTLYNYIHDQGNIISCQSALHYLGGIADALQYLNLNDYIHSAVNSHSIMLTSRDVAKLCNFELACQLNAYENNHLSYDPYKLEYIDPEYENIKEFSHRIRACEAQDIKSRSIFAPYRWQAPEQFDESAGMVYACDKTDVYSLCLVLWECLNCSPPWKSLSYDQLSELYFSFNTGIRLPKDGRYPPPVFDILSNGLTIDAQQRQNMKTLFKNIKYASDSLANIEDVFISKTDKTKDVNSDPVNVSGPYKMKLKDIKKYEVTNLDETDIKANSRIIDIENSHFYPEYFFTQTRSHAINKSHIPPSSDGGTYSNIEPDAHHHTHSTEYYSILSPDLKRSISKNTLNTPSPKKLDEEKLIKLNSIPKSYKSLEIATPPFENLNRIMNFNKFSNKSISKQSTYVFDVDNVNLPETPIARNTKIRRNAWLSGESENFSSKFKSCDNSTIMGNEAMPLKTIVTNVNANIVKRARRRHSLIDIKFDPAPKGEIAFEQMTPLNSDDASPNLRYRTRSQSWSTDHNPVKTKSQENITGVDIKPLVAIHEKWIEEARKKSKRFLSLSNHFGTGMCGVKPASHLIDSIAASNSYELDYLKDKNSEHNFEHMLWHKEKSKCLVKNQMNNYPKCSSTPYRNNHFKENNKIPQVKTEEVNAPEINIDPTFRTVKSSMLAELTTAFEKMALSGKINDDIKKVYDSIDSCQSTQQIFDKIIQDKNQFDYEEKERIVLSDEDESMSLPENSTQYPDGEELVNKALKRCQAFSAIQDARSTEDMYIDDEFNTQVELHNLGENLQIQSTRHERTCEKGEECCLIKLKKEMKCDRILLYCETYEKNVNSHNSPCDSEEDLYGKQTDIIDLSLVQILPVIEERSEEDSSDRETNTLNDDVVNSMNNVQDLISLYENTGNLNESFVKLDENDEIDFIILDDVQRDKSLDIGYKKSIIDDIIHV